MSSSYNQDFDSFIYFVAHWLDENNTISGTDLKLALWLQPSGRLLEEYKVRV